MFLELFYDFIRGVTLLDSTFKDQIKDQKGVKSVKTEKLSADQMISKELKDVHPEVLKNITKNLKSSNVDRNKYRDLFLIKKRIINDNGVKITEFDITERIIPKQPTIFNLFSTNVYFKFLFFAISFCLSALVITTTMKMYQSIIKLSYIKRITKNAEIQQIQQMEV
ncbi:hypothetical protein EHP00_1657 [Ecytonucleospora hepatopenaei]|uniref:Uncharacterized protein n=1 Tax=Ecytonucleospora hepatopenaei TaxID=646526 RepID=A0A1W0E7W3_9MICR|nr:hypothetical protein EHP00_1657 [Ecytonucleospora hepatopenaei]